MMEILRKTGTILMVFVLLLATTGVTIGEHYCGGKLVDRQISSLHAPHCCCADMQMPDGCCNDKVEYLQLDDQFTPTYINIEFNKVVELSQILFIILAGNLPPNCISTVKYANYIPPLINLDLPLVNQSLLI